MTTNLTFAARGTILHTRTTPGVSIVSFPGPAQLSIAFSMEKRGEPGIFSHVWAWCNLKVCRTNRLRFMYFQPTTCSMLGVYNSRPLIARYMRYATRTLLFFAVLGQCAHAQLNSFPHCFYPDITHMRKDTRPFLTLPYWSDRKLGGAWEQDLVCLLIASRFWNSETVVTHEQMTTSQPHHFTDFARQQTGWVSW